MKADSSKKLSSLSVIESLPDGSFVLYPLGKQMFRQKDGRFYVDCYRSNNRVDLERMVRFQKWSGLLGSFLFLSLSNLAVTMSSVSLIAVSLAILLLYIALLMPTRVKVKIFTTLFPTVQHTAQDLSSEVPERMLRAVEKRGFSPFLHLLIPILFAALIYFTWTMVTQHRQSGFWNPFISASPFLVLVVSSLGTAALLGLFPSVGKSGGTTKFFFPVYVALSFAWIGILNGLPGPLTTTSNIKPYKMTARGGVEWRTEITQADEPQTWPFKESSYMLSCLGIDGNYSVYIVKTEDISFKAGRSRDFVPQYYGLKGSLPGWQKGESQLLSGQSTAVFQRYVDMSLELCRKAEANRNSKTPILKEKK